MRQITKGPEPPSLTAHRKTKCSDYDNFVKKDKLRQALVNEQREICCYCMSRIGSDSNKMKIEHWQSQSRYPKKQLNYQNLLGACTGGQGQPPKLQHCDTRKGERDLKWNPSDPGHHIETRLRYGADGSIRSDNSTFDKELDDVLNLNISILKNNRKAMWVAIIQWWKMEKARLQGPVPRALIEKKRNSLVGGGALKPYSHVGVWWLEQRLRGLA